MASRTLLVVETNARNYRRTWKGSAVTTIVNPILFLAALGLGLGSLVDANGGGIGYAYAAFIAPGLLAANAMQTGSFEASWPVMAGIKWIKTYHAAIATPIGARDLVNGNLSWVAIRLILSSVVFVIVASIFGVMRFGSGLVAVLPAVLTGLAFAAPLTAYTARLDHESRIVAIYRFAIIPMFLFSGTFFPVDQLPGWLQPVAYATPLWHGVELSRAAALVEPTELSPFVHVAYLIAWTAAGWVLAVPTMRRRLKP